MAFDLFIIGVVVSFVIYLASLGILMYIPTPFVKKYVGRGLFIMLVLLWISIAIFMVAQAYGLSI